MDVRIAAPYVDTRAADLTWALSLPPLPALAVKKVQVPGGVVELRLLGSSHQAVFRSAGHEVSEAVACLPGADASLPSAAERVVDGARYSFRSRVFRPPAFRLIVATLALVSGRGLVGRFPGTPGALTVLTARGRGRRASWRTWHTYPQTGEIVLTSSSVRWT